MKKILSAVISLLFVSMAFGQAKVAPIENECPPGTCPMITIEITTFNFHKPRTNCTSGFGFCIRIRAGVGCHPCSFRTTDDATTIEKGIAKCWGELKNGVFELHLPAEIQSELNLKDSEISTFTLDRGFITLTSGSRTFLNKQGVFPVERRENDLVISIDME